MRKFLGLIVLTFVVVACAPTANDFMDTRPISSSEPTPTRSVSNSNNDDSDTSNNDDSDTDEIVYLSIHDNVGVSALVNEVDVPVESAVLGGAASDYTGWKITSEGKYQLGIYLDAQIRPKTALIEVNNLSGTPITADYDNASMINLLGASITLVGSRSGDFETTMVPPLSFARNIVITEPQRTFAALNVLDFISFTEGTLDEMVSDRVAAFYIPIIFADGSRDNVLITLTLDM